MTVHRYEDTARVVMTVDSVAEFPACARVVMAGTAVYVPADEVPAVCAALRDAAGLPPAWTVEKTTFTDKDLTLRSNGSVCINPDLAWLGDVGEVRTFAAQLLAAADEAEARSSRPKPPTAFQSVVKLGHEVWTRGSDRWTSPLPERCRWAEASDEWMARQDFTVLHDPDQTPGGTS